jgi:hypothetical protein
VASTGNAFVRFEAPLTEGSRILQLTRHHRLITVWWVLADPTVDNPAGPFLQATIAEPHHETKKPSPEYYRHLSDEYGFQLSFNPPAARAVTGLGLRSSLG